MGPPPTERAVSKHGQNLLLLGLTVKNDTHDNQCGQNDNLEGRHDEFEFTKVSHAGELDCGRQGDENGDPDAVVDFRSWYPVLQDEDSQLMPR